MKEINFNQYASITQCIKVEELSLDNEINNKIFYTKFNDIYVNPKLWSVITSDFYIFNDFERYLSPYKHYKEILIKENEIKEESKSLSKINGNFFLFGGEGNYWHFLLDFIPRLFCLQHIPNHNLKIIIPDNLPEKFINYIIKLSKLLNIKEVNFFKIDSKKFIYYFDSLIFTSKPSISFSYNFFHKILDQNIFKIRSKNLYVKRGKTNNRKVLNEENLIEKLKLYNYLVIDCADLLIEDQISIFSKAKNIIIPSGAAMANLLFVPENINVIEIRSNLDGDFSSRININNKFILHQFEKTLKVGDKLRKDIIVDIDSLEKLIQEKKIF